MATVLAQGVGLGAAPVLSAASAGIPGDGVECGPNMYLIVVSGSTACTLTITTPVSVAGLGVADTAVVIPLNSGTVASAPPVIIPLDFGLYADPTLSFRALLTWSAITNVKFAVVSR